MLPLPRPVHKVRRGVWLWLSLWPLHGLHGQEPRTVVERADVLWAAGAATVYVVPHLLGINDHPPSCAPCNRDGVPWFDRWAIREPQDALSAASTGLVFALAALETADLARSPGLRYAGVAYLAESAGWALGAGELLKAVAARKRPVLYTPQAPRAASDMEAQRSWPSGHTAVAFALAAGYVLVPRPRPVPALRRWAVALAAASVGVLRVAAGYHFPSDVAAGAALGVASAAALRVVRF